MTLEKLFLEYEIAGSRWVSWVWFGWGQDLAARYYLRKVKRKLKAYNKLAKRL